MADINSLQTPGLAAIPSPIGGLNIPAYASLNTPAFTSLVSAGAPAGLPSLGGVTAATARAAFVGHLSVPQSWTAAAQVANHAGVALPGGGWTSSALPESSAGVPGMPGIPVASTAGRHFGSGPRYGFPVTVMPRPPAAG
jgi:hypothetical protein